MNARYALCATATLLVVTAPAIAQTAYGPRLEGFDYPYEVQIFPLQSQGAAQEMAFMDVAPTGEANRQTALLLHGKNFCGATWEGTIQHLSDAGWRVITPDQIGFCKSSKPEGYQYSFDQLAANTAALLESLNVEKVTVIGHSMGGMLASRFAVQYPDLVERLALVNPIGLEDWRAKGVPYATIDQSYKGQLATTADSIRTYQETYYYPGGWQERYERWVDMAAGPYLGDGAEQWAWAQAKTDEMVFTQPVIYDFPRIQAPTLLLIGERDTTAPGAARAPEDVAKTLGRYPELAEHARNSIPGAELITFPEMGHSPQIEDPDAFHKALSTWLAD